MTKPTDEALKALDELESRYSELYGQFFSDYDKSIGKENIETIRLALTPHGERGEDLLYNANENGKVVLVARQRSADGRCYTALEYKNMPPHETAFLKSALDKGLNEHLLRGAGCEDLNPQVSEVPLPSAPSGEPQETPTAEE